MGYKVFVGSLPHCYSNFVLWIGSLGSGYAKISLLWKIVFKLFAEIYCLTPKIPTSLQIMPLYFLQSLLLILLNCTYAQSVYFGRKTLNGIT
jgi:hypothetical protein